MSRYPWADAPEWAMWAATDEDGERWWHSIEPVPADGDSCGYWNTVGQYAFIGFGGDCPDWRDSLEPRPESPRPAEPGVPVEVVEAVARMDGDRALGFVLFESANATFKDGIAPESWRVDFSLADYDLIRAYLRESGGVE